MRHRRNRKPLGTMTLILTAGIFLIMLTVMTLQGFLMYLYWRIFYQADIPIPQFWRPIPLLAVLSAVVGAGLTLLLSRIPLKPIRDLIEAINQLADGNFKVRIHLDLNREFERLSESFNRMAQELENTELLRSDFINNFSHEFKTPIVSLRGFAKILKNDSLTKEERDEYLDIIISESNRLSQLSTNVLNLSKIEKMSILSDMESFDLSEEVRQSVLLLRSDFINNFSHEFKTPIVSLRGFAKILKNDSLTKEERDEYLDIIISESNRLSQLSTNVLNLSKIEKMSILSDMESFDLSEEVRQSVLLLESKWQKKNLELFIDMDELEYHGNKALLNQVWINLIDNAIKFSPQNGKIKLKLHRKKDQVVFQILDNGCGMDEETKNHIFDRFYQGDSSHTAEGNGIGLTVVEKIVHLHKGQISVVSEAGIGTTFTVNLPIIPPSSVL